MRVLTACQIVIELKALYHSFVKTPHAGFLKRPLEQGGYLDLREARRMDHC